MDASNRSITLNTQWTDVLRNQWTDVPRNQWTEVWTKDEWTEMSRVSDPDKSEVNFPYIIFHVYILIMSLIISISPSDRDHQ